MRMTLNRRLQPSLPTKIKDVRRHISAVDLFCGSGGLTRGLLDSGIKVQAGYDIDSACQHAYAANNNGARFYLKSVSELTRDEVLKHYPKGHVRVLAGCAPCQPFSKYTQGQPNTQSDRWGLFREFGRLVEEVRPEISGRLPSLRRVFTVAGFEPQVSLTDQQSANRMSWR